MPVENALQFIRGLTNRRAMPAVMLIAGPQPFLREYALDAIRGRLTREGFNYRACQVGVGVNFAGLISELSAADLFAPKRLIACRVLRSHRERGGDDGDSSSETEHEETSGRRGGGAAGDEAALIAALDHIEGPLHLALLYERDTAPAKIRRKVEQSGIVVNCLRPFDNQLAQYAETFARLGGIGLTREAAELLAARHGNDLSAINNALALAAIHHEGRTRIEAGDLVAHASLRVPELFELSESMTRGRLGESIGLFDRALQTGRDPIELLAVEIIPMLRRMMVAAAILEKRRSVGEVAKALGYPPTSILLARAVEGARRLGGERLARAHRRACELDTNFKMGLLKEREQTVAGLLIDLMAL
ncbi:MAG: DNA polymerase III subunit delta [Candidatus Binataceae bacterium]